MASSLTARVGRFIGVVAVAGVLALILGGLAAAPAEAKQQQQGHVSAANQYIWTCFQLGGDPSVYTGPDGTIYVSCHYPDGGTKICSFYAGGSFCGWLDVRVPVDPRGVNLSEGSELVLDRRTGNITVVVRDPSGIATPNQNVEFNAFAATTRDEPGDHKPNKHKAKRGKK